MPVINDANAPQIIRPLRWQALRADEAERIIRERANVSSKVVFSNHAFERIKERSITQVDALAILRQGHVEGVPELMKNAVDWKILMVRKMPEGRDAGAVTLIFQPPADQLFVMTVE